MNVFGYIRGGIEIDKIIITALYIVVSVLFMVLMFYMIDNNGNAEKVYVDGEKDKIYKANFLSRGVALPAGEHDIIFRFEPSSVKIGLFISGITLVLILSGLTASALYKQKGEKIKRG